MKMRTTGRRRSVSVLSMAVVAGLFVAGCSQHQDPMGPSGGEVVEIEIRNFEFSQPLLQIERGTTVRWRNTTTTYHTVTPDGHTAWREWQTSGQDQTFEVRFDDPGTFPYYCMPHRPLGMTGTIVVS